MEGARRTFSKPLTKEILRSMWIAEIGDPTSGSLWKWRNYWLLNMMFRTCSRFADVCKLTKANFSFQEGRTTREELGIQSKCSVLMTIGVL